MRNAPTITRATILVTVLLAVACGGLASAAKIPSTPDGTVKAVSTALADNHPEILWEADEAAPAKPQPRGGELQAGVEAEERVTSRRIRFPSKSEAAE